MSENLCPDDLPPYLMDGPKQFVEWKFSHRDAEYIYVQTYNEYRDDELNDEIVPIRKLASGDYEPHPDSSYSFCEGYPIDTEDYCKNYIKYSQMPDSRYYGYLVNKTISDDGKIIGYVLTNKDGKCVCCGSETH